MIMPASPYSRQVRLLVSVLPMVGREACFALKGGTAINLFVRDMPRLSVDIDLAFLPTGDRAAALQEIDAALDRQHPRDLFDVKLLLAKEGIDDELFRAFLVYLISHDGSIARVLNPTLKPLEDLFARQFVGMTTEPVTLENLEQARDELIGVLHGRLGERERAFLVSFKRREPKWELLGVAHAPDLPAIRWKLQNLAQMTPSRHRDAIGNLERVLDAL